MEQEINQNKHFSPKTLEIVEKSRFSVFVVRNSRLSEIKARYFWHMIAPRLKENRFVYKIYSTSLRLIKSRKRISDEEYFSPKI